MAIATGVPPSLVRLPAYQFCAAIENIFHWEAPPISDGDVVRFAVGNLQLLLRLKAETIAAPLPWPDGIRLLPQGSLTSVDFRATDAASL